MLSKKRFSVVLLLFGLLLAPGIGSVSAALTKQQKTAVKKMRSLINQAAKSYVAEDYEKSGKEITKAIELLDELVKNGDREVYRAVSPWFGKLARGHALIDLEGVSLPPFRRPKLSDVGKAKREPKKKKKGAEEAKPPKTMMVSFTKDVAPMLVQRCGGCHINDSKGGFSATTFAVLMKGPAEGVVVFPGDAVASRLVETIETGDMPRGGGQVSPKELKALKDWILQGAKFDGPSPEAPLTQYAQPASGDGTPARVQLKLKRPTGKETVSFASQIAPILSSSCKGCHLDTLDIRGGLDMSTFASLLRGGPMAPIIKPGDGEASMLVRKLRGLEGTVMPLGRPMLPDESIKLISTWISEGAAFDGMTDSLSVSQLGDIQWITTATHQQMLEKRLETANENWKLGAIRSKRDRAERKETENFYVIGSAGQATLQMVADAAEKTLARVQKLLGSSKDGPFFKGRVTIFVLPKRYEYSEFSKMVEQRSVPDSWTEHWHYNIADAYLSALVSESVEQSVVEARLVGPLASLAVATKGYDIPRWMSEGIGRAVSERLGGRKNPQIKAWREALPSAMASLSKSDDFLSGQLSPEKTDLISYGFGSHLLKRYNRQIRQLLKNIGEMQPFEQAFIGAFKNKPQDIVDAWLRQG